MIRAGIVGIGFMGWIHYLAYQRAAGVQLAAICSRSEKKRRGDWTGIQGNFGPPAGQVDLTGVAAYAELDQLLADPSIDLIDVCLPPSLHAEVTVAALRAGKHVFCEKPIAVSLEDAQRMTQAAAQSGRQLLIGHVLPFFPEYQFALQVLRDGRYGRLLGGIFKRIISDPTWLKEFYDPAKTGGPLVDLHIHDAHFIRVAAGMPQRLFSTGRMRGAVAEFAQTHFLYDHAAGLAAHEPSGGAAESSPMRSSLDDSGTPRRRGPTITAFSGVVYQQGRPFTHGFEIHLERATLLFDFSVIGGQAEVNMPLTVLTDDGQVQRPQLTGGDPIEGFVQEIEEVARSIDTAQPSALLSGELARDALLLCHLQTESLQRGTVVEVPQR
jgi:predicted dehydrogenase